MVKGKKKKDKNEEETTELFDLEDEWDDDLEDLEAEAEVEKEELEAQETQESKASGMLYFQTHFTPASEQGEGIPPIEHARDYRKRIIKEYNDTLEERRKLTQKLKQLRRTIRIENKEDFQPGTKIEVPGSRNKEKDEVTYIEVYQVTKERQVKRKLSDVEAEEQGIPVIE